MSTVVLHQWEISPFCGKVRKILKVKEIPYSIVNYNGLRAPKAAKLSPAGKLPVLDYDGERIQDSSAIAQYIEKKHPSRSLYPEDPAERARCRILEDWSDESLYWYEVYFRFLLPESFAKSVALLCEGRPAFERWLVGLVVQRDIRKKLKAQGLGRLPLQRVEEQFFGHLDAIEALLTTRNWIVGDHVSMADISVSAQLDEMLRTSHLRDRILAYSKIKTWLARC